MHLSCFYILVIVLYIVIDIDVIIFSNEYFCALGTEAKKWVTGSITMDIFIEAEPVDSPINRRIRVPLLRCIRGCYTAYLWSH